MSRVSIFLIYIDNELCFRLIATDMLQALNIASRFGVDKNFEIKTAMLP